MEELKIAVDNAKSEMNVEQLAVKYGISSQTIYRAIRGEDVIKQPRIKQAVDQIIKDFTRTN